jgi:hypothetical protein
MLDSLAMLKVKYKITNSWSIHSLWQKQPSSSSRKPLPHKCRTSVYFDCILNCDQPLRALRHILALRTLASSRRNRILFGFTFRSSFIKNPTIETEVTRAKDSHFQLSKWSIDTLIASDLANKAWERRDSGSTSNSKLNYRDRPIPNAVAQISKISAPDESSSSHDNWKLFSLSFQSSFHRSFTVLGLLSVSLLYLVLEIN